MFFLHKWGGDNKDRIDNFSIPFDAPQNTEDIYSHPFEKTVNPYAIIRI